MRELPGKRKHAGKTKQQAQTSLREELCVDVFKSVFVDDPAGTFLQDKMEMRRLSDIYVYSPSLKLEFT